VACFYAFFVEIVIHKDMRSCGCQEGDRLLGHHFGDPAGDRRRGLGVRRIPDLRADARSDRQSRWSPTSAVPGCFLLAVNLLLLVVGMFMDIISATLILTPIFLPLLASSASIPCISACS
jgi:hypothetical protein